MSGDEDKVRFDFLKDNGLTRNGEKSLDDVKNRLLQEKYGKDAFSVDEINTGNRKVTPALGVQEDFLRAFDKKVDADIEKTYSQMEGGEPTPLKTAVVAEDVTVTATVSSTAVISEKKFKPEVVQTFDVSRLTAKYAETLKERFPDTYFDVTGGVGKMREQAVKNFSENLAKSNEILNTVGKQYQELLADPARDKEALNTWYQNAKQQQLNYLQEQIGEPKQMITHAVNPLTGEFLMNPIKGGYLTTNVYEAKQNDKTMFAAQDYLQAKWDPTLVAQKASVTASNERMHLANLSSDEVNAGMIFTPSATPKIGRSASGMGVV